MDRTKSFRHDDVRRVAALRPLAVAPLGVVRAGHTVDAVLLLVGPAGVAFAAGVDEAADTHPVADLVIRDA
jgi:hypothetical protein